MGGYAYGVDKIEKSAVTFLSICIISMRTIQKTKNSAKSS